MVIHFPNKFSDDSVIQYLPQRLHGNVLQIGDNYIKVKSVE